MHISSRLLSPQVTWREVVETYRAGWTIFLSTAMINLYTRSNVFIFGFFAGEREIGYFGVAQRIIDSAKIPL